MKLIFLIGILTTLFPAKLNEPPKEVIAEEVIEESAAEPIVEPAAEPTEELKCSCFDGEVEYGVCSDDIDDIPDEVWDIINEMEAME